MHREKVEKQAEKYFNSNYLHERVLLTYFCSDKKMPLWHQQGDKWTYWTYPFFTHEISQMKNTDLSWRNLEM